MNSVEGVPEGWEVVSGKLHREYKFADFAHAFGFMATAAPLIEKMDHHPDWSNVYNRVTVDLWTDRKSTRLNSSHIPLSRMPSSA